MIEDNTPLAGLKFIIFLYVVNILMTIYAILYDGENLWPSAIIQLILCLGLYFRFNFARIFTMVFSGVILTPAGAIVILLTFLGKDSFFILKSVIASFIFLEIWAYLYLRSLSVKRAFVE